MRTPKIIVHIVMAAAVLYATGTVAAQEPRTFEQAFNATFTYEECLGRSGADEAPPLPGLEFQDPIFEGDMQPSIDTLTVLAKFIEAAKARVDVFTNKWGPLVEIKDGQYVLPDGVTERLAVEALSRYDCLQQGQEAFYSALTSPEFQRAVNAGAWMGADAVAHFEKALENSTDAKDKQANEILLNKAKAISETYTGKVQEFQSEVERLRNNIAETKSSRKMFAMYYRALLAQEALAEFTAILSIVQNFNDNVEAVLDGLEQAVLVGG